MQSNKFIQYLRLKVETFVKYNSRLTILNTTKEIDYLSREECGKSIIIILSSRIVLERAIIN